MGVVRRVADDAQRTIVGDRRTRFTSDGAVKKFYGRRAEGQNHNKFRAVICLMPSDLVRGETYRFVIVSHFKFDCKKRRATSTPKQVRNARVYSIFYSIPTS